MNELKTTVYEAQTKLSFKKVLLEIVKDFRPARELGYQLFMRDTKAAYRQSILGLVWAFIPPIVTSAVWIVLNSSNAIAIADTAIPYPVFVLAGTLMWQTLTESINQPLNSVNSGKSILSKLNFPRESLLIHALYTVSFNALLKLPIIIAVLLIFGINPGWQGLLFIPFWFGIILTGFAIGMFMLPIGMMFTDISRLVPYAMQFIMYLTPIIYPIPKEGILHTISIYNPFCHIIDTARAFITGQEPQFIIGAVTYLGFALLISLLGVIIYRFIMPIIIERVGA